MEEVRARQRDGKITHGRETRGRNDDTEDRSDGEMNLTEVCGGGERRKLCRTKMSAEQEMDNINYVMLRLNYTPTIGIHFTRPGLSATP